MILMNTGIMTLRTDPLNKMPAANSLSDVFAMGGEVMNALNIVGFDEENLHRSVLDEILAGGLDKIKECGGVLVGGHTIVSPQMYYGLCVTGYLKPGYEWKNNTPKVGDVLILTKPLGMGIMTTAIKNDLLDIKVAQKVAWQLAQLNQKAMQILRNFNVSACTDITGFGLLGHSLEMASNTVTLHINAASLPIFEGAKKMANAKIIPGGSYANQEYIKPKIKLKKEFSFDDEIMFYDAQTSGGLLVAVPYKDAKEIQKRLIDAGYAGASIIGEVAQKEEFPIIIY